jgi:hypothetical protein
VERMKLIYDHVDDVDLFVAGISETPVPGNLWISDGLKGQMHEIFHLWFFLLIDPVWAVDLEG